MRTRLLQITRARSAENGFIVVAVLWILAALATLATIFSMYVINTATAFAVHDERLQAEGLGRAAIELSVYQVAAAAQTPASRGTFAFRIGNANVNAEFMAETARIDLNAAPRDLLAGLVVTLGATRDGCRAAARRPCATGGGAAECPGAAGDARCRPAPRERAEQQVAAGDGPHRVRQRTTHDHGGRDLHPRQWRRALSHPHVA